MIYEIYGGEREPTHKSTGGLPPKLPPESKKDGKKTLDSKVYY